MNFAQLLEKPDAHTSVLSQLSGEDQLALYTEKDYNKLSEHYLLVFEYLDRFPLQQLSEELRIALTLFIERFLFFFTQADFEIQKDEEERFISVNATLANLLVISELGTTDTYLKQLGSQPKALAKLLTLYSARNTVRIDRKQLFDLDPHLSSLWYLTFFDTYTSALSDPNALEHLRFHLRHLDPRLELGRAVNRVYFSCTYIDPEQDAGFKRFVNTRIQEQHPVTLQFGRRHQNNKIAVFSGCWRSTHAVYKNQFAFLDALREDYQLTFFPLRGSQDTSLFHRIDHSCREAQINLESFRRENFAAVYFPDVGMTEQSVILANLRLAPLQISSFGHSVSSFGSQIDYFLAGEEVEDIARWEQNYSERLVLLPGLGMVNALPTLPSLPPQTLHGELRIACPWSSPKCSLPILESLQKIISEARLPLTFVFFAGGGVKRANGYLPFLGQLKDLLRGAEVEVIPHIPYEDYLEEIARCHFALDSFHFGGCNSVVDALLLGKPIVTRQGSKWYNRIAGAQLKHIGLDELVHEDEESYCKQVLRLINEQEYRAALEAKIQSADIANGPLFSLQAAEGFKQAIDYLMKNHQQLAQENSKTPVDISSKLSVE